MFNMGGGRGEVEAPSAHLQGVVVISYIHVLC